MPSALHAFWVVEGSYANLVKVALQFDPLLLFLNPETERCPCPRILLQCLRRQAPGAAADASIGGSLAQIEAQFSARGIQHAHIDGGITIREFLRAGLIQRLIVTRVPVLIGSGIPLFGTVARDIPLKHIAMRQYASGLVQSEYQVGT